MNHPTGAQQDPLIGAYLTGESSAVSAVDGWIDVVLRAFDRTLGAEREDMRQEIRLRVLRNLKGGQFDGRSALRTYVHRIAKNACIDHARRAQRRLDLQQDVLDEAVQPRGSLTESGLAATITGELLSRILGGLTEEERMLLRLVLVERFSYDEVAQRMDLPTGTVKSRVSRCRDRLLRRRRELLEESE